jgi:hypothetical protein
MHRYGMLIYAVLISFLLLAAFAAVGNPSGRQWAGARLVALSFLFVSLTSAGLLFAVHPGWKNLSVISGSYELGGRQGLVLIALQIFISIGPKGCAILFLCAAIYMGPILKGVYKRFRRADYAGITEARRRASYAKRTDEALKKAQALLEAIKEDQAWIDSNEGKTFVTRPIEPGLRGVPASS